MLTHEKALLCLYRYDPLDRLVSCVPSADDSTERFYCKDRLSTEIQGAVQRSVMQHEEQLLAQQQHQSGNVESRLLVTDQQRSVLSVRDATEWHPQAYTPYGDRTGANGLLSLLGFNGERPDSVTGYYLLGKGYRAFNPVLMRFNGPDGWSPFGRGGLNCYAYCLGDPVNNDDPTGHMPRSFKPLRLDRSPSPSLELVKKYATRSKRREKPSNPIARERELEASQRSGTAAGSSRANVEPVAMQEIAASERRARARGGARNERRTYTETSPESTSRGPLYAPGASPESTIHAPSAPRESVSFTPSAPFLESTTPGTSAANATASRLPRYSELSHQGDPDPVVRYTQVVVVELEPYKKAQQLRKS